MQTGGFTLRELERKAKLSKLGMWEGYIPPAGAAQTRSDSIKGPLVEVVSGDCVVIHDTATGKEHRLYLSSVRAPRLGRRGDTPEPWAVEAKEYLRSKYIGRTLEVAVEYTRKDAVPGGGEGSGVERTFASCVYKGENIAVWRCCCFLGGGLQKNILTY